MRLGSCIGWILGAACAADALGDQPSSGVFLEFPRTSLAAIWNEVRQLPEEESLKWERRFDPALMDRLLKAGQTPWLEDAVLLAKQFYGTADGLEHPRFLVARVELDRWIEQELARRSSAIEGESAFRRQRLDAALKAHPNEPSDVQLIVEDLAWLEATGNAGDLRRELSERYRYPNIVIHARRSLMAAKLEEFYREIQRSRCAQNLIAGACVSGPAHVNGSAVASLPEDPHQARVGLFFQGVVDSPSNTAVKGKVRVFSSGTTEFQGVKWIFWRNGRLTSEPAELSAATRATLHGVDVPVLPNRRFVNGLFSRYAMKKAEQAQPQGEHESARIAERQLGEEFDREVELTLAEANDQLNAYYHAPLTRLGIVSPVTSAVGASYVALGFRTLNRGGLGVARYPDQSPIEGAISVAVHESVIDQLSQPAVGGSWWTDHELAVFQKELIGENSHPFRLGPHYPSWAIQFRWRQPISTKIEADQVTFCVKLSRVRVDAEVYEMPLRITATFGLKLTGYGVEFARRGPVNVESLRGDVASDPMQAIDLQWNQEVADFMREKFSGLFEEIVFLDGLSPPAGGTFDAMSKLETRHMSLEPGWIRLGFDSIQSPSPAAPQKAGATTVAESEGNT